MLEIKAKCKQETEKELAEILGMSINDFCEILDNIDSMVKTETAILSGTDIDMDYIDTQIENGKEILPW